MSILVSIAVFALASSISPGRGNLVSLSCGARHGLRAALPHVTGATLGFILLLLLTGLGLHEVLNHWPWLTQLIRMAGVIFLLYLAYRLASSDGRVNAVQEQTRPSALRASLRRQSIR